MKRTIRFILFMLAMGMLPVHAAQTQRPESDFIRLYCLNIGKADCMILSCYGKNYLIDTGYEHTYPAIETALKQLNITELDGVFLTHCHQDHEGGLLPLARSTIGIHSIYAAKIYYDVKEKKHPARLAAKERNMDVSFLEAGDVINVTDDTHFTVLGPLKTDDENENNNSLVMRFSSPHGSILFAGDMKNEEENDLLQNNLLTPTDVLKCGHHGDNKATSAAFLKAVQPKCAIILTHSAEEPDTPSPSTISRLQAAGSHVYVSQNAQDAIGITLRNGEISVDNIVWDELPEKIGGLTCSINRKNDTCTLRNNSIAPIVLAGCTLHSSEGNDTFSLPEITLQPGESYVIGNKEDGNADYRLDKKTVWHQKKRDVGIVMDAFGRILTIGDNGIKEN